MKAITTLLLTTLALIGCAPAPRLENETFAMSPSVLDSAQTLIRRGMADQASGLLVPGPKQPGDTSGSLQFAKASDFARYVLLMAKTFEADEDWSGAACDYGNLAEKFPDSTRFRVLFWGAMLKGAQKDTLMSDSLRAEIRAEGNEFAAKTKLGDLYLAYSAAAMLGDSVAEARGDRLCEMFPTSDEANDLIGGRFWDGLYPIWENDSAKVPYLQKFIQKYSQNDWALYARRNLIGSYFALKDTASAIAEAAGLVYFGHDAPLVLSQAAGALFDLPQAADSVKAWAERAYQTRDKLARPSYYSPPEWALIEQATRAGFPLTLAAIRLKAVAPASPPVMGSSRKGETGGDAGATDLVKARQYAEESLKLADYDLDDNNTAAPQEFMLGRIAHLEGKLDEAALQWTKAAEYGDVYNRYAGRAVDSLKAVFGLKDDKALLDFCRKTVGYKGIRFENVTAKVRLDSASGGRVAWGDFHGNGWDDLLAGGTTLFTKAVTFEIDDRVPEYPGFARASIQVGTSTSGCHGGIWGDFDNDGQLDLFCFSSSGDIKASERLLRKGKVQYLPPGGTHSWPEDGFIDVTGSSGSLPDSFSTEAAIWFDANGDGRLDLYIPGYEKPAKGANDLGNAWPSRLMVQDEQGVFHDSTAAYGLLPKDGRWLCGRSPVACDFDRDGDQDLYVGNYRLQENQFWVNQGVGSSRQPSAVDGKSEETVNRGGLTASSPPPRFSNLAAYYEVDGAENQGCYGHTIGCEWGDFDGDGDFDLIVCNLAHPRYIGFSNRTMLYRNDAVVRENGKGKMEGNTPNLSAPFTDVRKQWGIKYDETLSEPVWGDFDNDGDLDLYMTSVYPNRRSFLYENKGDHFEDVTFLSGTRTFNGWGCATSDYDNDGKLDLAVCAEGKIQLFRNVTDSVGNWIEIAPERNPGVHLSQIGGIVEIYANGKTYIRQFEGGKGAGSQNSGTLHFGIGPATSCDMKVSNFGREAHYTELRANQKFEIGKESVGIGIH